MAIFKRSKAQSGSCPKTFPGDVLKNVFKRLNRCWHDKLVVDDSVYLGRLSVSESTPIRDH